MTLPKYYILLFVFISNILQVNCNNNIVDKTLEIINELDTVKIFYNNSLLIQSQDCDTNQIFNIIRNQENIERIIFDNIHRPVISKIFKNISNKMNVYRVEVHDSYIPNFLDDIADFVHLKEVEISGTEIKLLDSIIKFANLESIILVNTKTYNIPNMNHLGKLRKFVFHTKGDIRVSFKNFNRLENLDTLILSHLVDDEFNIERLKNLKLLKLYNIYLKNIIGLKELKSLKVISINNIRGFNFQSFFSDLSNLNDCLEVVILQDIVLREIPKEIIQLKYLKCLNLGFNHIQDIPSEVENLKNLEELVLDNNDISKIPKEISKLNKIRMLSIKNNIVKNLPKEILMSSNHIHLLQLTGNLFSMDYIKEIKQKCPEKVIIF